MSDSSIPRRAFLASALPFSLWAQSGKPTAFTWKSRLQGAVRGPAAPLALWYRQPARTWVEALPLGNGRLGAMCFGGVESERIQLNEESIWQGSRRDSNNHEAARYLPEVRRLLFAGKELEATELASKTMMGQPMLIGSYQPLGDLWIEMPGVDEATDYSRWLDLDSAESVTTFRVKGVSYTRTTFVSAVDQLVAVRVAADKPGAVSLRVRLTREKDAVSTADPANPRALTLSGQVDGNGVHFVARLEIEPKGGKTSVGDSTLIVENADQVVLRLVASTDYREKSPEAANTRALRQAAAIHWNELEQRHTADHRVYFRRVALELPANTELAALPTDQRLARIKNGEKDESIAALYFQYGRYLLLGSSRPGTLPANLQGVWNEHLKAPWNSDYHTNINLQMNYWLADATNIGECNAALFDYMDALAEAGAKTAKYHYAARGWVVHHLSDIFGFTAPADGIWGVWPMGGAWLAQHPWQHYLFTGDREFLARRGYPLMKGAAEFILDFLVEAPAGTPVAGKLVTAPSHSPENRFRKADGTVAQFTYAATMDIEICRDLLANCIAATRALGTDSEFRSRCEQALARLPELRISPRTGRLMEWIEDYDEPEPQHRHISHMFGLHPSDQIDIFGTPALAAAARKTLEVRGDKSTGWSTAWKMNFWARLQEPERAYRLWTLLIQNCTLPNLFDTHPPFQIDGNFGATSGIAEMLLQSQRDEIRLLPALPAAWHTGKVSGLKARGAFEVSLEWQAGKLTRATLLSRRGNLVRLRFKQNVAITCNGRKIKTAPRNGVLEFSTGVNKTYEIRPA